MGSLQELLNVGTLGERLGAFYFSPPPVFEV